MSDELKMMLVIEAGKSKGKKILLKKNEYSLGAERKSNIRLHGEFVSPLHAVIKLRDEGQWIIQNRSPNQTLVNNQVVDTKPLVVGDSIQIGASNLLRFDMVASKKKSASGKENSGKSSSALNSLMKRPAVVAGLLFYIIVLGVVFSFLAGKSESDKQSNWNTARIEKAIQESNSYLLQQAGVVEPEPLELGKPESGSDNSGVENDVAESEIGGSGDDGAAQSISEPVPNAFGSYDSLLKMQVTPDDDNNSTVPLLVQNLMSQVAVRLDNAWHFERQRRWDDAIQSYDEVLELVPDINVPITKIVVRRKRWAQKQKKQDRQ